MIEQTLPFLLGYVLGVVTIIIFWMANNLKEK